MTIKTCFCCLSYKLLWAEYQKLGLWSRSASAVQAWYKVQGLSDRCFEFGLTSGIKFLRIYFVWKFDWVLKDKARDLFGIQVITIIHDFLRFKLQSWDVQFESFKR